MRFQTLDIPPDATNPVTGHEVRPDARFAQALTAARTACTGDTPREHLELP